MPYLVHELIQANIENRSDNLAVTGKSDSLTYAELWCRIGNSAANLARAGMVRHDRVAVYLDKRPETVVGMFAAAAAGGVFVPVNPVLKAPQVGHILGDSGARYLITTVDRFRALQPVLAGLPALAHVVLIDREKGAEDDLASVAGDNLTLHGWSELVDGGAGPAALPHPLDSDMAAILYTSGSTGKPKGVVLSHRNLVVGAESVAQYLELGPDDNILAALPFSFDAGLSQLTTSFAAGARVVLHNYLLPRDLVRQCGKEGITGLTCVPPLWMDLAQQTWPEETARNLRYFANTGGHMPRTTLSDLRKTFPRAKPFLMYGLTEAFRSTYLDPEEVDKRPDSIGKAIPNAEILVVDGEGQRCAPGEVGELVHRGPLVAMGYWNDPERTAKRFKPAPLQPGEICLPDTAVWSGDLVRTDEDGFLYFVGRNDEMIKTSGYRVSPAEIEEVVGASGLVGEVVALGVPHPRLGQAIVIAATHPASAPLDEAAVQQFCRQQLPLYMVPSEIRLYDELPRNANGKFDRSGLRADLEGLFDTTG